MSPDLVEPARIGECLNECKLLRLLLKNSEGKFPLVFQESLNSFLMEPDKSILLWRDVHESWLGIFF